METSEGNQRSEYTLCFRSFGSIQLPYGIWGGFYPRKRKRGGEVSTSVYMVYKTASGATNSQGSKQSGKQLKFTMKTDLGSVW